jgi:hypothetical protein
VNYEMYSRESSIESHLFIGSCLLVFGGDCSTRRWLRFRGSRYAEGRLSL